MKLPRLLCAFALLLACTVSLPAATPPGKTQQITSLDQVPDGLAKSDWHSIRAAYVAGLHAFQPIEGGWQARNPGQQWTTKFDGRGFVAQPRDGGWTWGLELKGYGFPGAERAVGGVPVVKAEGQRLTYGWDAAVEEWWVNDQRGLEHGFTVKDRPLGAAEAPLQFDLAVRGSLAAQVAANGLGVEFRDGAGATVLTYAGLKVWDADGKILDSRFVPVPSGVRLLVEERGARYPLTIDPVAQQAFLKSTLSASDNFGASVAIWDNTVVVGAPGEDSNSTGINSAANESATDAGAVFVFVRNAVGAWTQQAYLKPTSIGTTQAGDRFGSFVSTTGDLIVVGAPLEDSSSTGVNGARNESALDSGAAYILLRNAGAWTQQAYLKPAAVGTTQAGDQFGSTVATSGNSVAIGAAREDSSTLGVNSAANESAADSGAAYVFVVNAGVWTQQAYLKPAVIGTTQAGDQFGLSVSISDDVVLIGAPLEDSSVTGVNSPANETATDSGAAYLFVRSAGSWTQEAFLKPGTAGSTQVGDRMGTAVGVSGDTAVVGAPGEDSSVSGLPRNESAPDSGTVYIFTRFSLGTWTPQGLGLKPNAFGTTQTGDNFGAAVSIAGNLMAIGAPGEDSSTTGSDSTANESAANSGAAYVFVRVNGLSWLQQAYTKAGAVGTSQVGDAFGSSVSVAGVSIVVGAPGEDSSTTGINSAPNDSFADAGAASVYTVADIVVEQPAGAKLITGISSIDFGTVLVGSSSAAKTFTIRKNFNGSDFGSLTISSVAVTGGNAAADFVVNTSGMNTSIPYDNSTTFTVTFTPQNGVNRATTLRIVSSDQYYGTFDIALTGVAHSFTIDSDGDGLSDGSETQLLGLGFDWQVAQPALVATLPEIFNNAGYYDPSQVQALNVGTPLIKKNATTGKFTLTIGVEKTTNLRTLPFSDFPMSGPGKDTFINAQGQLEFEFSVPDNAAFFRVVGSPPRPLAFSSAVADFQQGAPYVIANSLLPNVEGWGVFGGVQAVRTGYFNFSAPASGGVLEIALLQNFGERAWIQQFELAVTTDPVPNAAGGGNWTTWVPTVLNSATTALAYVSGTQIRSTGTAANATYTLRGTFPVQGITGVRLKAYPYDFDLGDGLPASVGRSANGNFVLSEIKATADPY